jgi:adenylate cyclase
MSGVEIHANMVAGLLEQRFLARLPPLAAAVLAIVLGLAGSLLQFRWQAGRSALLTAGGVLVFGLISLALFAVKGWSVPALPALFAAVVPYGSFGLIAYFEVERKRREIRQAFGHYLAPAILEEILADPARLRLGGRTAEVTLLFTDLAGFTSLSERVAPSEVGRFLNRYFTEMTRIVFAHDGTVDKFIGDALVAFWGAPVADAEHALKACRAALAMQERMRTLREEMAREGLPELHMRIGVNSGEAIVGNMGSSDLFNYTALGDTVNLAARLEGANKEFGTSILISDAVRMRAGPAIRTRPLGALKVRGRSDETPVFELTGLADERTGTTG